MTVVDFLKEQGLYRGVADNPMRLGISSRSKDVIEPLLKPQWWVACGDMAARSVAAVRDGTLEIIPKVCVRKNYSLVCAGRPCVPCVVLVGCGCCCPGSAGRGVMCRKHR